VPVLPLPALRRIPPHIERKATVTEINGETSDGYHTFNELYQQRMLYNALWLNECQARGKYKVHKSLRHGDGELCFGGGWFVVVAETHVGQITNHYALEYWDHFRIPERDMAAEWDGHTPEQAAERMEALLQRHR
jgi:hypothetical protein